jgi:hypothetical protein
VRADFIDHKASPLAKNRQVAQFINRSGRCRIERPSTLTLLPAFAFFLFFRRLLINDIATTGLKE